MKMRKKGKIICPDCEGTGKTHKIHDDGRTSWHRCMTCVGEGYIDDILTDL